jgi:hypothetical protein
MTAIARVTPAKAGVELFFARSCASWIPASAGMTLVDLVGPHQQTRHPGESRGPARAAQDKKLDTGFRRYDAEGTYPRRHSSHYPAITSSTEGRYHEAS